MLAVIVVADAAAAAAAAPLWEPSMMSLSLFWSGRSDRATGREDLSTGRCSIFYCCEINITTDCIAIACWYEFRRPKFRLSNDRPGSRPMDPWSMADLRRCYKRLVAVVPSSSGRSIMYSRLFYASARVEDPGRKRRRDVFSSIDVCTLKLRLT